MLLKAKMKAKLVTNSMLDKIGMEINDEWKKIHRLVQTWLFALIGISGDIYNELSTDGLLSDFKVPDHFLRYLHIIAVAGVIVKLFRKKQAELDQEEEAKDNPPKP